MRAVGLVAAAAILSACHAPTGDFGRPKPTVINDTVLPLVGREIARARGEPVSYARLTDLERELRARSYRLVMPMHRRGFLAGAEAELVRARIWPDEMYRVDPTLYYRKLRTDGFVSSEAPYNAMLAEIRRDAMLLKPFYDTVRNVCLADARRLRALDETVALTALEAADAKARVYENRRVVDWALAGLAWRVESYAYALQRSRIGIPSKRDEPVGAALDLLAEDVADLEAAVAALRCDATLAPEWIAEWPPPGVTKR